MTTTKSVGITIPDVNIQEFTITLVGDPPGLIVHNWDEKTKKMILDKQMKKAKPGKQAKDPVADFEATMYRFQDGGHGFPASGFKASAVNACRQIDGISMTEARGAFQVVGDLVKLKCSEPVMREDMVRIGMGTSDIRYRAMYVTWEADITIRYNADFMSKEQIVNLFNTAGFCSGIGEWRPSAPKKPGPYGMFHVKRGDE